MPHQSCSLEGSFWLFWEFDYSDYGGREAGAIRGCHYVILVSISVSLKVKQNLDSAASFGQLGWLIAFDTGGNPS